MMYIANLTVCSIEIPGFFYLMGIYVKMMKAGDNSDSTYLNPLYSLSLICTIQTVMGNIGRKHEIDVDRCKWIVYMGGGLHYM